MAPVEMAKPVPRTFVQDMPRKGGFPSVRCVRVGVELLGLHGAMWLRPASPMA